MQSESPFSVSDCVDQHVNILEYAFQERKFLSMMNRKGGGREMRRANGRREVSLVGLVAGAVVAFVVLGLLTQLSGPAALAVLAGGFAVLGGAGWLWGANSVDGRDWCPRESELGR
jgi:hypothetical protein